MNITVQKYAQKESFGDHNTGPAPTGCPRYPMATIGTSVKLNTTINIECLIE